MLGSTIKTYFKNIQYVFVAMGVIYFVLLVGLFGFAKVLVSQLAAIPEEVAAELMAFVGSRLEDVTLRQVLTRPFIEDFLGGAGEILSAQIKGFVSVVIGYFVALYAAVLAGVSWSQKLCGSFMRRETVTEYKRRGILAAAMRYLIDAAFVTALCLLLSVWQYSAAVILALYVMTAILQNLFTTWMVYFGKYKLKDIFNGKNSFLLIIGSLVIFGIDAVILALLFWAGGILAVILAALPLLAYTPAVLDAVSVAYFKKLESKGKLTLRKSGERKVNGKKARGEGKSAASGQGAEQSPAETDTDGKEN